MVETNKPYEEFKTEFRKWQEKFGLMGYKIYFRCEPIDLALADITVNQTSMLATVRFNPEHQDDRTPASSGKHEAIHLLVQRVREMAYERFLRECEVEEAVEELVIKLEELIQ